MGTNYYTVPKLKRSCYGFEIKKDFCKDAKEKMLNDINMQTTLFEEVK